MMLRPRLFPNVVAWNENLRFLHFYVLFQVLQAVEVVKRHNKLESYAPHYFVRITMPTCDTLLVSVLLAVV
jgi:hypothetical protein